MKNGRTPDGGFPPTLQPRITRAVHVLKILNTLIASVLEDIAKQPRDCGASVLSDNFGALCVEVATTLDKAAASLRAVAEPSKIRWPGKESVG